MERVKPEIQSKINENLRALIEQAGNVTAFARSIGVSRDSVNNWLSGKSDIRLNDLVTISQIYKISVDFFLGLAESPTREGNKQTAENYTGLSAEAVEILHEYRSEYWFSDVSLLLENKDFLKIILWFDDLRMLHNKTANAVDYLMENEIDQDDLTDEDMQSIEDLTQYLPELRMMLFELSEKWSDLLEQLFPSKEIIEIGKNLYGAYRRWL